MNGDRCPISCVFFVVNYIMWLMAWNSRNLFLKGKLFNLTKFIYTFFGNVFWWVCRISFEWWILSSILGGGFCKLEPQEIVALFCNSNRCFVAELTFYFHKNSFEKSLGRQNSWSIKLLQWMNRRYREKINLNCLLSDFF